MTESKSGASETIDVRQEIQDLRKNLEVQAATPTGATATQAATHAGTWSTMVAGSAGLIVGMFLALAFAATTAPNDVSESDAPIPESDDEYGKHDDAPSDAEKARDEQAKQEESGQENPT
jgi:hypothetical protein